MSDPAFNSQRPLAEQLIELKNAIRSQPGKATLRTYYFQLLCVLGEWQKAVDQLQVCAQLDPAAAPMARAYREVIMCEVFRAEVFAGRKPPHILGEPTPWVGFLTEALKQMAEGQHGAATKLCQQALDLAPMSAGTIDDQPFTWFADADNRLGPVCELYANGCYYWLPFEAVKSIRFEKPQDLRDMVWQACEVTLVNGGSMMGFIPSRYPIQHDDEDAVKLAHKTLWHDLGSGLCAGKGQRLWATNENEYALLDVRQVHFEHH